MVFIHPIISSKKVSFYIFFWLSWKFRFEMWPVYIYYMLSMLGLWCGLGWWLWILRSWRELWHWDAWHLHSWFSHILFNFVTLYWVISYIILFNLGACDPSLNSISLFSLCLLLPLPLFYFLFLYHIYLMPYLYFAYNSTSSVIL